MNYQETIDYLYARLPLFSRIGEAAIKKDLTNTIALCKALGDPQDGFRSIHIAGTNGKGSTSHMLASIFQEAGYKTGLYTSPHLVDFRERIRINGEMIPKTYVTAFTERVMPLIQEIEPSFFELTVAMAFCYFKEQKVDIAIIETGLGGRLDSTNIITPELSLITNIGWDHMNLLGSTLPAIASEKAGIIKSNTPVVISEYSEESFPVFESVAKEKAATLHLAAAEWKINDHQINDQYLNIEAIHNRTAETYHYKLDLTGQYQSKNLLAVLSAAQILNEKGWTLKNEAIQRGLSKVKINTGLRGRWDVLGSNPTVIADVAHNTEGIREVLDQLKKMKFENLHWIIGMVKDKEIEKVLALLPLEATYYFTRAAIPRALPENELKELAYGFKLNGTAYPDVKTAKKQALLNAGAEDLILICGSVFIVGEIMS